MPNTVQVQVSGAEDAITYLDQLPIEVRGTHFKRGLSKAADIVVRGMKQRAPVGGPRKGEKADKKHLGDTIGKVYREYGERQMYIVGPQYPAGAHGHLVEFGHRLILFGVDTGRRVPPHPFARPAAEETKSQQQAAIIGELKKGVTKHRRAA